MIKFLNHKKKKELHNKTNTNHFSVMMVKHWMGETSKSVPSTPKYYQTSKLTNLDHKLVPKMLEPVT